MFVLCCLLFFIEYGDDLLCGSNKYFTYAEFDPFILMPFCRPDTLDPALLRPGRLDRKVEFGLPDLESRTQIFKIHTRTMNCERDIRFELLARLCPNSTGK